MNGKCSYCGTPYGDDRDKNGLPFCDCDAAEVERLRAELDRFKPIPVTEKMPPAREYVMLFDGIDEQWTIGELFDSQSPQWSTIDGVYYHDKSFGHITHWMPLPEAPHETS